MQVGTNIYIFQFDRYNHRMDAMYKSTNLHPTRAQNNSNSNSFVMPH